jgi:hypothetical protein
MGSSADLTPRGELRAQVLERLRGRLESAHDLAVRVRERLPAGDVAEIESATAQLETVAQEFKVLAEEYDRLPPFDPGTEDEAAVAAARASLESTAARIARSAAVAGGLLERMVAISRGLLGLLGSASDGTYSREGRAKEPDARGLRLREWV